MTRTMNDSDNGDEDDNINNDNNGMEQPVTLRLVLTEFTCQ